MGIVVGDIDNILWCRWLISLDINPNQPATLVVQARLGGGGGY